MSKLRSLCWSLLGHLGLVSFLLLSVSPPGIGAPIVRITKPQSGQFVVGQTWIEVAYRAEGSSPIQAVQLYVDHQLAHHWRLPVPKIEGTQSFSWDFSFASGTTHTVTAKAIDTQGAEGAAEIIVQVRSISSEQPDQIPPVVNIYYPAQGAEVEGEIELKANATDNVGVKAVFFYVDGKLHTMIMNAPPYVTQWDTTRTADGPHVIKASAWDKQDNRGNSAEVTVLVKNRSRTTAAVATATAAAATGTDQAPVVAIGPIADAATQPQPAADAGVVAQTFGSTPTVARPAAPEPTDAEGVHVAAVPDSEQPIAGHRISQPARTTVTSRLAATPTVSEPASAAPTGATLVRLSAATTAKATGEAARPNTGVESVAGRYAMVAGPRSTAPATSIVSPPAPPTTAGRSVKPPRPQETVEYQVAMLPETEASSLPHAGRVSKPATGVSLPREIGELRDIKVAFDGEMLDLRAAPEIRADISMGPLREIFEQTDGVLYWFAQEKKVRAVNGELDISLQIGNPVVKVNDQEQELILAPYIKCGRTMVPLQFLADTLDVAIRYNPATGQLVISSIEF